MIALYIVLGILGMLFLLLCLPAGVYLRYSAEGMSLKLVYGPLRFQLLPSRGGKKTKKEKKPGKAAPKKVKSTKPVPKVEHTSPKGGKLKDLMEYIPIGRNFLGAIRRSLLMRRLVLLVNLAGNDPCDLALLYGKANAGVACAMPLLERAFRIRQRDIQVFCDFTADSTEVYAELEIVACPARLIAVALRYGWRLLRTFMKQKSKKAVREHE